MFRKTIRLRKEYLQRKGLEQQELSKTKKKQSIHRAVETNRPVPTELRNEEDSLRHEMELEDENTAFPKTHIDDEYADVGLAAPKVLITTSRKPSSRLLQFLKELKIVIPNATRVNRGNYVIEELAELAQTQNFSDLVILHEHRGRPDGLIISHFPSGPTTYFALSNVVLRHDLKTRLDTMSEEYPHLVFHNFQSKVGDRVAQILKALFPVPKLEARRVLSFINKNDFIVFRHHTYEKEDYKTVTLSEIGPRFVMKLYQIKLGTVELEHTQTEWVLRPYMNTAHKRKVL
jgi:U3 small nucleolar ribonucleoprotein protein IMP4